MSNPEMAHPRTKIGEEPPPGLSPVRGNLSGSRENALFDTMEHGARAKIVKGAGSIAIVIREQGA